MLTQDQIADYRRKGYLKVEGMLTSEQLAGARRVMDEFVERSRSLTRSDDVIDLEDDHTAEAPRIRRLKDPHKASPVFDGLLRDERILDMVEQLIGPDIRMHHTKLNVKPPGGGEAVEWHQDWAFYPATNDDILEVGLLLDDATEVNGALLVVPGSHLGPVHDHHVTGFFAGAMDPASCDGLDLKQAIALTAPAGSMTMHHVRTVHGSRTNNSDRPRRLLLFGYAAADAWPLVASVQGAFDTYEAQMLRGRSTLEPRLAPVPVRLPLPPAPNQGSIFENQRLARGRSFQDRPKEVARV
jgi:ectoine hydroxylase-related dioxygenase (phytanoyl-CoA dioxygenase family)